MDFSLLTEYLDSQSTAVIPGMDLVVYKDHAPVYRHLFGFKDREAGVKMTGKEKYWLYSATKVFTVTAGMQLIEKGIMSPDDPVSKFLPAFATLSVNDEGHIRAPKNPLLVKHLFTMTGGFDYNLERASLKKAIMYSGGKADTLTMINALAEEPLCFDPGTHFQYSLCHDVLAAVIEKASGMKFSEYLTRNIFEPLGIKNTGFKGEDISEFAQQYNWDEKTNVTSILEGGNKNCYRLTENYESGGAGLYSTVEDYILFADALACGGVGANGKRILKSESIDYMRTDRLTPEQRKEFINHTGPSYSYGMGVRTVVQPELGCSPKGEFGWDGAACSYVLCDPENRLSVFLGMHIRSFGYGYFTVHHRVKDLVYEALKTK